MTVQFDETSSPAEIAAAVRSGGLQRADDTTETPSAEGTAPAATTEAGTVSVTVHNPADEAPSADGTGDQQPTDQTPDAPKADESKSDLSDLPDWAVDMIKGLRAEAAKSRVEKKEALKDAIPATEVEKIKTELQAEIEKLRIEGLREKVLREIPLPDALAKRLKGSTKEELEADARELQALVGTTDSRELYGGLTPGRVEPDPDPSALARELRSGRLF